MPEPEDNTRRSKPDKRQDLSATAQPSVKRADRKPGKSWRIAIDLLIAVLVVGGLYLILQPIIVHLLQDNLTNQLAEAYDQGDGTIVINPDYLEIPGEEVEYPEATETWQTTTPVTSGSETGPSTTQDTQTTETTAVTPSPTPTPALVTIQAIGVIKIPSIKVNMPIAEDATRYNLRVAIGHLAFSAGLGQPGDCILFGHRMYTYGRHFNRLGEVTVGQQIILEDKKSRYTYEVDLIQTVLPSELGQTLANTTEGNRITLVTCTPVKVASHRLLVRGKLVSTEPLG